MRKDFKSITALLFLFSMSACFDNETGISEAAENSPNVVIAFKASELKDVIWVTPAILIKNHESDDEFDIQLQIMIFDGDELIIKLPEATPGQYKFKWKLGNKGQILLKDLDPESGSSRLYEIWKIKDDSEGFKITNDYFSSAGQTEEISLLKPQLLNNLSYQTITLYDGREFGHFEGSQYKFNIYQNDTENYYGDVSGDRFQNSILVKTDHSADRYMLFEGLTPEQGTLLKFSYWRIQADQPPMELGAIYRIKILTQEDYNYEFGKSSSLNERYFTAHIYK